jgi:hypothetical protein
MAKIWLKNAAGFITADTNGEVALSGAADALPTLSIPSIATPNGWTLVEGLGMSPEATAEGDTYTSPSGREYSDYVIRRRWNFKTLWFAFPSEFATFDALQVLLAGNNVVFVVEDYDVTIHTAGKGVAVTAKVTPEHDYELGRKRLAVEFRRRVLGA